MYEPWEIASENYDATIYLGLSERYHEKVEHLLNTLSLGNIVKYSDSFLQELFMESLFLPDDFEQNFSKYMPQKISRPYSWDKILIIRLDGIGDMVLTTPFLRELRRNHPRSKISLLLTAKSRNLFEYCPYIDELLAVENTNDILNSDIMVSVRYARKLMYNLIGERHFDVVINPRYETDAYCAGFLAMFCHAPYRVGFSETVTPIKQAQNKNYDMLYSKTIRTQGVMHEVQRSMELLQYLGCTVNSDALELWCTDSDFLTAKKNLSAENFQSVRYIAIGLGGGNKNRHWKVDNYIKLIKKITATYESKFAFILMGGNDDSYDGAFISSNFDENIIFNLVGKLTLREVYATLRCTIMYIGNDTGLMHIAAAATNRVVEISNFPKDGEDGHANDPVRFGPYKVKQKIVQPRTGKDDCIGYCHKNYAHCINDVSVEDVFRAAVELLDEA